MPMKWNGKEIKGKIDDETTKRLARAAGYVVNEVKKNISQGGNKGLTPSGPGEYPHKNYGRLRASISSRIEKLRAYVGTNVKYGKWLELGTKKLSPRPFLVPTVKACAEKIKSIMKG